MSSITNAEIIEAFNKLKEKAYILVKELEESKPYKIVRMFRHKTKFGNIVIAELEDAMLYLPKRYNSLEDKVIEGAGNEKFILTKKLENHAYILELRELLPGNEYSNEEDERFYIPNSQPIFCWEPSKIPRMY